MSKPTANKRFHFGRWCQQTTSSERGAMLMVLVGALVAMIGAGAVAVDLSARMNDAQHIQNAVDAASLGGVVVWVDTADETATRARVDDLMSQNGATSATIHVTVDFVSSTSISVSATDSSTNGFIAVGFSEVTRSATSSFDKCSTLCGAIIPIPRPFLSIDAEGSGDGFRPAVVGTKLYGVNHHSNTMACVDRLTQLKCFEDGNLFNDSDYETDWTVSEAVVGSKIYYVGQSGADITLFCWETISDVLCPSHRLAELPGGEFRGGAVTAVGARVYAVTDNHRMHCYRPNGSTCPFFGSDGLPTGLGILIAPLEEGDTVGNMDQVLDPNSGRIYYSLKTKNGAVEGTYIDCWDTNASLPCANFAAVKVDENPDKKGGRLFLHHPSRALPTDVPVANGVCATNDGVISCFDFIAGTYNAAWGNNIADALVDTVDNAGTHIHHPPTNRLVLQAGGLNLCYDFDAQDNCGFTDAGANKDYGYAYEGNCVFALGHNSNFHSFGMTGPQLSNDCPGTSSVAQIDPCSCAGGLTWPDVRFEFEFEPFTNFTVRFLDPSGAVVMGPLDMTTHPTGQLDLSEIPTTHEFLIIETVAEVEEGLTTSPWDEDTPPEIKITLSRLPLLVD